MAFIFFSISFGQLDIVKVLHKAQIWEKLVQSHLTTQTILTILSANDPPSPRQNYTQGNYTVN